MREHAKQLAASRRFLEEEDVDVIQALVLLLADRHPLRVLDLGAGSGTTALAVLDVREDAEIMTVDIDIEAIHWAERAVRNCYPAADWGYLHDNANVAVQPLYPYDLLLHDAGHARDDVESDLRAWLPHVRTGGLVWVHDYLPPPVDWGQPDSPGVALAVETLVSEGLLLPRGVGGMGWTGVVI